MAAAIDAVGGSLLAVWDVARERTTSRLSSSQLRAVVAVEQHQGINLRGLAEHLGMLVSSASRLCDRLVAAGMLQRESSLLDRREISLHLTAEGEALLTELRAERRSELARVLAEMTPAGRQALLRGLSEFAAASELLQSGQEGFDASASLARTA